MKLLIGLLFVLSLPAATVLRIACGGIGGTDTHGNVWAPDISYSGGYRFAGAVISGQPVPYNAMRSSSPAGAPFSYTFQVASGQYNVTLLMLEPRFDQTAGQRLLNVALNGTAVVAGLDLFTAAGALKPYSATFPVTVTGLLKLDFSATAGNALVSGIQVDSVDAQTSTKGQCESGVGDGTGPMFTGTRTFVGCENLSGIPQHIMRARCRSSVAGQVFDLLVPDATGAMTSILAAPIICTPTGAEGQLVPGASYQDGQALTYSITIVDTPPTNASWVLASIVRELSPPTTPVVLTGAACQRGTTDYTALTALGAVSSGEVTIATGLPGSFRPFNVLLSETSKFASTTRLAVSMGRPGLSTDAEMTNGASFPLEVSGGDANYFSVRPIPPQITGSYSVALNFTASPGGNLSDATAGLLTWEICGIDSVIATPFGSLKECQGGGTGWSCNGLLWATFQLSDNSMLQLVGAPMPGFQPAANTTWVDKR